MNAYFWQSHWRAHNYRAPWTNVSSIENKNIYRDLYVRKCRECNIEMYINCLMFRKEKEEEFNSDFMPVRFFCVCGNNRLLLLFFFFILTFFFHSIFPLNTGIHGGYKEYLLIFFCSAHCFPALRRRRLTDLLHIAFRLPNEFNVYINFYLPSWYIIVQ